MNNLALYTPIDIIHVVMPIFAMTIMGYLVYKWATYNKPKKKKSWAHKKIKVHAKFKKLIIKEDGHGNFVSKIKVEGLFEGKNRVFTSLEIPKLLEEYNLPPTIIVYVDEADHSKYYVDLRTVLPRRMW